MLKSDLIHDRNNSAGELSKGTDSGESDVPSKKRRKPKQAWVPKTTN